MSKIDWQEIMVDEYEDRGEDFRKHKRTFRKIIVKTPPSQDCCEHCGVSSTETRVESFFRTNGKECIERRYCEGYYNNALSNFAGYYDKLGGWHFVF